MRLQPLGSLSLPKAPGTSARDGVPAHSCGNCRTPMGVSAIPCKNDVDRIKRERLERVKAEGARLNAETAFAAELESLYGKRI